MNQRSKELIVSAMQSEIESCEDAIRSMLIRPMLVADKVSRFSVEFSVNEARTALDRACEKLEEAKTALGHAEQLEVTE